MDKDRIAGAANDIAGKVEGAAGDLAGDARTQASGRARVVAGMAQNLYGQVKDATRDVSEAAASYAEDAAAAGRETFQSSSKAIAGTVRHNPIGSLLIAAGIGFTLALMMTRPARGSQRRWRYYG